VSEVSADLTSLGDDLLYGAGEISEFFYGDRTPKNVRRVYHQFENGRLPLFKIGMMLHARKSTLLRHCEEKERAAIGAGAAA
jgi:hypothetical protein